jgi:hypothetical protein
MKKWLLPILLCFVLLTLAGAAPFLSVRGPIMDRQEAMRTIVVNERSFYVDPSTPITDQKGKALDFHHLRPGRWVFIEAEPDDDGRMVAQRIVVGARK